MDAGRVVMGWMTFSSQNHATQRKTSGPIEFSASKYLHVDPKIIQKGQQTAKIEPEEKTEIVRVDGF